MKSICLLFLSAITLLAGTLSSSAQLIIKGIVQSEGLIRASLNPEHSRGREVLYLHPAKIDVIAGDTTYTTKYEVPERMVKNENYILRFTDGTVEKIVYVSGAIPKEIAPKQRFMIDINLLDTKEPEMTMIVYWSLSQSSYRALPLSKIDEIRADSHSDFFWNDGTVPDKDSLVHPD